MTRGRRSRFIPRRLPARFLLAAVFVSAVQGCSTPGRVFPDDPAAWQRQFLADYPKDGTAAAHDLAVIAERWPDRLSQFPDATIAYVLAQTSAGPQAQFDLLRQLYAAHWTLQCGIEPSGFWLKYVQQLVARGDLELARDVVKHIREPRDVLILRVDRRYIALAAADPALPTVEQAAIQSIDDARAAAQRCPRSVEVMENLLAAMLAAGHDEDVLTSDDEFLDELARSPHSFQDAYLGLHSLLNARASAFVALGRWAEAEQAYRLAVRVKENGGPNVSQRLNLAEFLIRMGRVNEADSVLPSQVTVNFRKDRVQGAGMSQYGALVFASVKLQEALRSNDQAAEELIFAYIAKHRKDSAASYREALLRTHRTDDYARALIEDLRDPTRRADTLVRLQHFKDTPKPPGDIDFDPEIKAVIARPEVQQTIREVGSLQSFEIPGDFDG